MADKTNMAQSAAWRDRFKIDDKILKVFWENFSQNAAAHSHGQAESLTLETASNSVEFVLWCVAQGHFSEEDFTRFQSEQSSLPVLRKDFFAAPIDHEFWNRVKDLHPWNSHCVPLTEWEGHLLIGSVWPGGTFKNSLHHLLVLATPSELRSFHEKFVPVAAKPTPKKVEAPVAAPIMTPPVAVAPPVAIVPPPAPPKPVVKPAPPVAKAPLVEEAPLDPNDPFAALTRELARLNQESGTPTEEESAPQLEDSHEASSDGAPEGLVIPEGLSFGKDELSRLMGTDTEAPAMSDSTATDAGTDSGSSDGGTLVHNFETGEGEVVTRKPQVDITAQHSVETPALEIQPMPEETDLPGLNEALAQVPVESPLAIASEHEVEEAQATARQTAAAQAAQEEPAIEPLAPPSRPPAKPAAAPSIPSMPFAPSAAPQPPTPGLNFKLETPAAPPAPEPINPAATNRPAAEATVVIDAAPEMSLEEAPPTTKSNRRPLFEPVSSSAPTPPPTPPSKTDSTQTGTKGRKLEATPVTSFFSSASTGMGGAAARTPGMKPGRNPDNYLTRIIAVSKLEPLHLDECATIDEAGAQAILQACNIFETAMILLFKDGQLQPWKWNDLFLSVKGEKPDSVDLNEPSIFKIVFRTAKPYHGYVVTSTVNQKFFNEFYRGMLPKHATVIPVMIDGRMGGMMLGFTNSKIDYRQSLRLMERLSFDLGRVFKKLRGTMAKAS